MPPGDSQIMENHHVQHLDTYSLRFHRRSSLARDLPGSARHPLLRRRHDPGVAVEPEAVASLRCADNRQLRILGRPLGHCLRAGRTAPDRPRGASGRRAHLRRRGTPRALARRAAAEGRALRRGPPGPGGDRVCRLPSDLRHRPRPDLRNRTRTRPAKHRRIAEGAARLTLRRTSRLTNPPPTHRLDRGERISNMTIARFPPQGRTGGPDRIPLPATGTKSLTLRLAMVAGVVAAVALLLNVTGALDYLSFAELARNREWLGERVRELGYAAPLVFVLVYALCTAFSLPTGLLLSTLGGFLFGTLGGGLLNVVGATLGATMLFLAARTALGDVLRARAGPSLRKLDAGFRENELSYMLVLRLVPLFPFWLVNLAPAFLGVRTSTFVIGTFFGIIPGAFVFASVGTGLGAILVSGGTPDGSALLQPHILLPIGGLVILALIPVVLKRFRHWPASNLEQSS